MKNKRFFMAMCGLALVLSAALTGCPTEPDEGEAGFPSAKGKFTLTGVEKANGKYAFIHEKLSADGNLLLGITSGSGNKFKGAPIKNGSVDIPLYVYNFEKKSISAYTGNDKLSSLVIYVSDTEERPQSEIVTIGTSALFSNVEFASGKVTQSTSNAISNKL
jgi:hypothetical protein